MDLMHRATQEQREIVEAFETGQVNGLSFKAQRPDVAVFLEHCTHRRYFALGRDNGDRLVAKNAHLVHSVNGTRDYAVIAEGVDPDKPVDDLAGVAGPPADFLFEHANKFQPVRLCFFRLVVVRVTEREICGEVEPPRAERRLLSKLDAFSVLPFYKADENTVCAVPGIATRVEAYGLAIKFFGFVNLTQERQAHGKLHEAIGIVAVKVEGIADMLPRAVELFSI